MRHTSYPCSLSHPTHKHTQRKKCTLTSQKETEPLPQTNTSILQRVLPTGPTELAQLSYITVVGGRGHPGPHLKCSSPYCLHRRWHLDRRRHRRLPEWHQHLLAHGAGALGTAQISISQWPDRVGRLIADLVESWRRMIYV